MSGKNHDVTLCGLRIRSAVPLPEALLWQGAQDHPIDVEIGFGAVPDMLPDAVSKTPMVQLGGDGAYLLRVPGLARYLVCGAGRSVTIDPMVSRDHPDLRLFVLTSCLEAVMERRDALVLSGAVMARGGRAFVLLGGAVVGHSGLVAALLDRDPSLKFLSAECCILRTAGDVVLALPGYPGLMVPQSVLDIYDDVAVSRVPTRAGLQRYHWPRVDRFEDAALPLERMILIEGASVIEQTGISELKGVAAVSRALAVSHRHGIQHRPVAGQNLMRIVAGYASRQRIASLRYLYGELDARKQLGQAAGDVLAFLEKCDR